MVPAVGAGVRWFFPVQDDITDVFLSWKTSLFSAPLEARRLATELPQPHFPIQKVTFQHCLNKQVAFGAQTP